MSFQRTSGPGFVYAHAQRAMTGNDTAVLLGFVAPPHATRRCRVFPIRGRCDRSPPRALCMPARRTYRESG